MREIIYTLIFLIKLMKTLLRYLVGIMLGIDIMLIGRYKVSLGIYIMIIIEIMIIVADVWYSSLCNRKKTDSESISVTKKTE